jgi:sugar/nucleoside kinase (ribokinase family)
VSGALFVGVATLDVIQQVLRAPGPNEKVSSTGRLVCAGGPATNAAVTCAALGVPATLLSPVGHSVLGAAIRADLEKQRDPGAGWADGFQGAAVTLLTLLARVRRG